MIKDINNTSGCKTINCHGIITPCKVSTKGKGCGISVMWSCSGCSLHNVSFDTTLIEGSRTVIGTSMAVAFVVSGLTFANYEHCLSIGRGMDTLNKNIFYDTIKLIYPVVKAIRDEQCELAKTQMKAIPDATIGSRSRVVTSSDGVWMTRGYFSQKFSFTVWDYLGKNLLYYLHLSMRGSDDLVDEPLYPGISKSAEGYAAERVFKATEDEGLRFEVNWQDSDSSLGNAFKSAYPAEQNSKVMLCGGHVNRAHTKQLKEMPS